MAIPKANGSDATSRPPLLVVDDELIVLMAIRDLLQHQGYQVMATTDVVEAMGMLAQRQFAVVVTDQQMPRLTGLEFLGEVRRQQPAAARVLITGELELELMREAVNKVEIYRVLVKPWDRQELLQAVEQAMQHYLAGAGAPPRR